MTHYEWLTMKPTDLLTEVAQLKEEGRDIAAIESEIEALASADWHDPRTQARFGELMDAGQNLPFLRSPDKEPDALDAIRALRSGVVELGPLADDLGNRIYGAWLGRCAGCLLGKPIEGLRSPDVYPLLRSSGNWPLQRYLHSEDGWEQLPGYNRWLSAALVDRIDGAPEDDDTNYTTTALAIVKEYGRDFTSDQVAEYWLTNIPALRTCTAERVAYRNLLLGISPPESATYRNPYREWIGAQIRGDMWGYLNPGNPEAAAEMAWRDARVTHVRNGIYGEMWAAAMIAAAFATDDVTTAIRAGMAQIPKESRLHTDLSLALEWHAANMPYEEVTPRLRERYDEIAWHPWTHTITNAMVVAAGLLWGEGDFALSICRAVQPLYDTDCNGATVGSVIGAMHGAKRLPTNWMAPLADTLSTGVKGYERVSITRLAHDTHALI